MKASKQESVEANSASVGVASGKPKTVRFSELVKHSGKPENVTLWSDPKDNPDFMRAVDENRVLTIAATVVGTRADSGLIGFHQRPSALFFVFRKSLSYAAGTRVIGIKYEMLETPKPKDVLPVSKPEVRSRRSSLPKAQHERTTPPRFEPPPKPKLHRFKVRLAATAQVEREIEVEAHNQKEARERAKQLAREERWNFEDVKPVTIVKDVRET